MPVLVPEVMHSQSYFEHQWVAKAIRHTAIREIFIS
eukprot:CAMPEP_0116889794 /NCGR_PEP_ID=MMETSP0467-20121206/330_1 /TAXON_ID=283647 /ORGANISM="Mesodinium pulex, Strain SPMC105" /LENGTH=35 /DNA_ID= /DNA_START= /DNA_END= /DNA_ORIENTATION=